MVQAESRVVLRGKVAQILSDRELAINIGARDGVKQGMRFAVLAKEQVPIQDPDSGEVLDTVDVEKIRVQATEVRERVTICATYQQRVTPAGPFSIEIGRLFAPRQESPVTLRIDEDSYRESLDPEDSYIKIGDVVKQIPKSSEPEV